MVSSPPQPYSSHGHLAQASQTSALHPRLTHDERAGARGVVLSPPQPYLEVSAPSRDKQRGLPKNNAPRTRVHKNRGQARASGLAPLNTIHNATLAAIAMISHANDPQAGRRAQPQRRSKE